METEGLAGLWGRLGTRLGKLVETKGGHGAGLTAVVTLTAACTP